MKSSRDNADSSPANLIYQLRQALGLTQEKLAQRLGVSFPTINRWENGRSKPSPLALKQIEELVLNLGPKGKHIFQKYFGESK